MYKATLRRHYRNPRTLSPTVLLSNVIDTEGKEFRDHCWVRVTPAIERLLAKYNSVEIEFVANEVIYLKRGKEPSTTLQVVDIIRYK